MKYFYGEYDGQEFPTPDKLFGFDQLMQFILEYGEQALKAIEQMLKNPKDEAQSEMLQKLLEEGMVDKDGNGKLRLTPRAIGRMQRKALMEVFSNLRSGQREGHEKVTPGLGGERIEGTKPYEYGDPVSELDLHQTLHNALARHGLPQGGHGDTETRRHGDGQFSASPRPRVPASPFFPTSGCAWTGMQVRKSIEASNRNHERARGESAGITTIPCRAPSTIPNCTSRGVKTMGVVPV